MYTINELNLRSCMACFWRTEGLKLMSVDLVQDHFQYFLQLLEFGNVKNRIIETAYSSGMQATMAVKVFVRDNVGKTRVYKSKRKLPWKYIKV